MPAPSARHDAWASWNRFQRTACCMRTGCRSVSSSVTSARSQKRSRLRRCAATSGSKPAPITRSRVRRQRSASSAAATLRDVWYVAYLRSGSERPARRRRPRRTPTSSGVGVARDTRCALGTSTTWSHGHGRASCGCCDRLVAEQQPVRPAPRPSAARGRGDRAAGRAEDRSARRPASAPSRLGVGAVDDPRADDHRRGPVDVTS